MIEFVDVHKFTFGPEFRVTSCVRVKNSSLDFITLQGPSERVLVPGTSFIFKDDKTSIKECSESMYSYICDHAEGWFSKYRDVERLKEKGSPIFGRQCLDDLVNALEYGPDEARVLRTRKLFGL